MGYYQDCECEIPIYDVKTRYNPRLRNCKADGRLQFFYRVTFVCRTFHDLLMWSCPWNGGIIRLVLLVRVVTAPR